MVLLVNIHGYFINEFVRKMHNSNDNAWPIYFPWGQIEYSLRHTGPHIHRINSASTKWNGMEYRPLHKIVNSCRAHLEKYVLPTDRPTDYMDGGPEWTWLQTDGMKRNREERREQKQKQKNYMIIFPAFNVSSHQPFVRFVTLRQTNMDAYCCPYERAYTMVWFLSICLHILYVCMYLRGMKSFPQTNIGIFRYSIFKGTFIADHPPSYSLIFTFLSEFYFIFFFLPLVFSFFYFYLFIYLFIFLFFHCERPPKLSKTKTNVQKYGQVPYYIVWRQNWITFIRKK